MTYSEQKTSSLTEDEWKELVALKQAINENPATVHPNKMELFTELLVRSWDAKCDSIDTSIWRKGHPMGE